ARRHRRRNSAVPRGPQEGRHRAAVQRRREHQHRRAATARAPGLPDSGQVGAGKRQGPDPLDERQDAFAGPADAVPFRGQSAEGHSRS
nr:hypothetical protein [Tanacetum cinerariifolium]